MKICITSCGKDLESKVEARFGRSPYFIIWDTSKKTFEAVENSNINETSGVGVKSAQLMVDMGIKVVLSGQLGPKAAKVLESAKIEVIEKVFGTIKEAIEFYQSKDIKKSTSSAIKENITQVAKSSLQSINRCFGHKNGGNVCGGGGRYGGKNCICPKCGEKIEHKAGVACRTLSCPKCGSQMTRE